MPSDDACRADSKRALERELVVSLNSPEFRPAADLDTLAPKYDFAAQELLGQSALQNSTHPAAPANIERRMPPSRLDAVRSARQEFAALEVSAARQRPMIKPAFENVVADLWVHQGKLGVTEPSVCLFHDSRDSGAQILDAISELGGAAGGEQRTITFRTCSRPHALRKLKIKLDATRGDLKVMHIGVDRETATIIMTDEGLSLLKTALQTWLDGGEDFGVSPRHSGLKLTAFGNLDRESGELWFWGPGYLGP